MNGVIDFKRPKTRINHRPTKSLHTIINRNPNVSLLFSSLFEYCRLYKQENHKVQ